MELIYDLKDKPSKGKLFILALQQLLAILAGTITAPLIVGNGLSQSAALFGAGVGTLVYLLITKFRSPVFLGSSFTYLGSMTAAFAGAASASIGYFGIILGAVFAGLVYVILSIVVHFVGTNWISKVMPPVIIGPVVALIGLTLAPNAVKAITAGNIYINGEMAANPYICLLVGLFALIVTIFVSVHAKGFVKLVPFIIGILAGYVLASILTVIGNATDTNALKIVDFSAFKHISWVPDFSFLHFPKGVKELFETKSFGRYFLFIFVLYVPLACAVFAEHIADHKNLSTIINKDLLEDPGLSRTLMGDGVGSMVGAVFGGCPNTTYGESISCVAFSRNASIVTIITTCFMAIAISFVGPIMTFFQTIPTCVIGGLSIALYGYIASSGLRMLKEVDLNSHKNIFVISTIFIIGIGGLAISFKYINFSPIACALVAGILVNLLVNIKFKKKEKEPEKPEN